MPKQPSNEHPRDPATEEAVRRIEEAQKIGAKLDLSGLKLSGLPEAIGQLSQLRKLYLSGNQLSSLPEAIGQLSQLQKLYLSGNRLSRLPEAIGQLSQLRLLSLYDNQLSSLPQTIHSLVKLEKLFLHRNPGLGLPDEVLGPTVREVFGSQKRSPKPPREILPYYFATREGEGRALRLKAAGFRQRHAASSVSGPSVYRPRGRAAVGLR